MALALVAGIAGAFATSAPGNHKNLLNPNWQSTDSSGNVISTSSGGMYDPNVTEEQAQSDFGCAGPTVPCAVTVVSQNGAKTANPTYINQN